LTSSDRSRLPNSHFVQGNTDRYVVTGHRPHPSLADAEADPRLLWRIVPVGKSAGICEGRAQTLHELMSGLQVPWTVTYAYS
jgi:hypothetical protein